MKLIPVILSGGSGTRLWPVSRELFPKQLVKLVDDQSLFQHTLKRIEYLRNHITDVEFASPLVICNEQHRFLIAQQAQESNIDLSAIILEPLAKNTAPALTLAAQYIEQYMSDGIMLVLPADHAVEDLPSFSNSISSLTQSFEHSKSIGVFGITPNSPHTGYGYIEAAAEQDLATVVGFKEKPSLEVAEEYVKSGHYYWNSGMFLLSASVWLKALKQLNTKMTEACADAIKNGHQDLDFFRVDKSAFETSPSDSIDYAVIEQVNDLKAMGVSLVMSAMDCGWTDLGAWPSVAEHLGEDEQGNVSQGDVIMSDTSNTFVTAQQRMVATVGVDNLVVVETPDAVLVADKSQAQGVKDIVAELKRRGRDEHETHRRVYRPWGNYETVDYGSRYQVKRIIVNPGASLSLQMHHHRAEHWIVVKGTAEVTCGEKVFLMSENQSTYIPIGTTHRLVNPGKLPLELIEVQSGSYLGEDDIVRFEDIYGREKES
ncbi:mannose-1-phosphate guanylyltransferase/mannose-6-phosphate isomerase [Pleionea sp. CnH1-48]|uniref:mannose-1-phosphate guanylyltransferase/mannose-6-phosphate isomerase n=1 Tax=Pleionea sp. CnH1-48 TaxID=2954494 RepID=UPI002097A1FD|nr:mannose-1-phosphate guanylyltransferase/mannose-6-phosphate isomerase [Pleionea sp. CnH1-48]MCO7223818.1 mannose-1-phosphate guanylyltransferase/mannose-6-phosphate isomerase [Pleionea sp. CnH1-48]